MTSNSKAEGRFGKQDFPLRRRGGRSCLSCRRTARLLLHDNEDKGLVVHCYATNAYRHCAIKHNCTKGNERRIKPMGA